MPEKITRLAYIMSRFGIRAEEVSKRTGIDKTLISRWKNGQRRLSPASAYSRRISDFLLSLDNAEQIIGKTLNAYGLDESSGLLQDNFIIWLSEQDLPKPSLRNATPEMNSLEYTASFRIFLGREGLRSAIITMIDYVMTLPGPHNVVAVILSDLDWLIEDSSFANLLAERLEVAFKRGITFTVVIRENFGANVAKFSGLWLSAHLRGHIKSYYYHEEEPGGKETILLAVKDGVCLSVKHDNNVPDKMYTDMYTDNVTVGHVYHNYMEYFAQANMHFRYGFLNAPGSFLSDIHDKKLLSADCYVCSRVPSFGVINLRQAHLYARETLRATKQRTEQVKALFTTPDQAVSTAKIRHIFCLDSIEDLFLPGRTLDYPLSALYNKRIHHARKMVLSQLADIRVWLKLHGNYHVALVPAHIFNKIPLEFVCAKDNFCVAWHADAMASTCAKEHNKVDSLFGYAERLWEELPKYCKDRQRSLRQLNQWLAQANDE